MDGLRGAFKRKGGLFDNENQVRGKAANKPDDINPEGHVKRRGPRVPAKPRRMMFQQIRGVPARPPYA